MILLPVREAQYRFTQDYGARPAYYKKYGHKGHNGYDLAPLIPGDKNTIVYAPHDGYVRLADEGKIGYGKYIELLSQPYNKLGERRKSDLAHLSKFLVKDGQFVGAGDPLAIMGTTGDSSGIHLHWTYKIADSNGVTKNKKNGFNGAIPIAPYTLCWTGLKFGEWFT